MRYLQALLIAIVALAGIVCAATCPNGCISLSCPMTTVAANNTVLASLYINDSYYCSGITVAAYNASGAIDTNVSYLGCPGGRANYSIILPYGGTYTINASNGTNVANCTLQYFQKNLTPTNVPETNLIIVLGFALTAAALYSRKRR